MSWLLSVLTSKKESLHTLHYSCYVDVNPHSFFCMSAWFCLIFLFLSYIVNGYSLAESGFLTYLCTACGRKSILIEVLQVNSVCLPSTMFWIVKSLETNSCLGWCGVRNRERAREQRQLFPPQARNDAEAIGSSSAKFFWAHPNFVVPRKFFLNI